VKGDLAEALGHQGDPRVTAKMEHLMDRVEKEVLLSGSEAASGAKTIAAEIRKDARAAGVGVFAQAHSKESSGTKDPVRRVHLSKEALSNIAAAKDEVEAAYGTADGTAQTVEALLGQLSGSLQGLETGAKEDVQDAKQDKADEAQRSAGDEARSGELAKLRAKEEEDEANAAKAEALAKADVVKAAEAHAVKAEAVTEAVEKAKAALKAKAAVMAFAEGNVKSARRNLLARRFRRQRLQTRKLAQRTHRLALEKHHISKETNLAHRDVHDTIGDTVVGDQVADLLKEAAAATKRAATDISPTQRGPHNEFYYLNGPRVGDVASGILIAESLH